MSEELQEIEKLEQEVKKLKDTLKYYTKLFKEDGKIDDTEQKQIDAMNAIIAKIELSIANKVEELSFGQKIIHGASNLVEDVVDTVEDVVHAIKDKLTGEDHKDHVGEMPEVNEETQEEETPDEDPAEDKPNDTDTDNSQDDTEPTDDNSGGSVPSGSNYKFKDLCSKNDPEYKKHNGDPTKIVPSEYWTNASLVLKQLDVIVKHLGFKPNLNSGYRSPVHNSNVGGVSNSQHLYAKAADLGCSDPRQAFAIISGLMDAGLVTKGGLGLYNTFVHYDVRGSKTPFNKSSGTLPAAIAPNSTGESSENEETPSEDKPDEDKVVIVPINKSVGEKGDNDTEDVKIVQELLNKKGASLTVDGDCGKKTIDAIKAFQSKLGFSKPDGRVDPGGKTWKGLTGNTSPSDDQNSSNDQNPVPTGPVNKPNWIKIAEGELGVKENTSKTEHNPRVMEYHATTGITNNDETPWCSSFVNWVMRKAGQGGTDSAMAVSWKKYGKDVGKAAYGAIAVIDWDGPGPGWKGHVGFIVGKKGNNLLILGGNQSNAVNIKSFGTSKIVAYVFPSNYEVPANAYTFGENDGDFGGMDLGSTR